jgi:hypothetical protein
MTLLYFAYKLWTRSRGKREITVESNAKCRYLRKITCKGTLKQMFYLSEAPMTPYPLPLTHCTVLYTCIVYLFTQVRGGGGGGELTSEKAIEGNS